MTNIIDNGSSNKTITDQTGVSPGKVVKDVTPTITSPNITGIVTGGATYNNITLSGTSAGTGIAPLGAVVPVASNLSGSFSIPVSGTVSSGWQLCNGVAIPGGNTLSGNTPNLTDNRFLMGSSSAGTASGTNLITPVGSIGGSQSIQHHHTFAHTHTTDSQLGTISLNHGHTMDSHDHEYMIALGDSNFSATGSNSAMGVRGQAGIYDYNTSTFAGASGGSTTILPNEYYLQQTDSAHITRNTTVNRYQSTGRTSATGTNSTSSPGLSSALTNYNASHSHTTTSQNTTDTSDNTGSNAVNGSNFSFTGTQFDSRPQYFSVQYIIRVS